MIQIALTIKKNKITAQREERFESEKQLAGSLPFGCWRENRRRRSRRKIQRERERVRRE